MSWPLAKPSYSRLDARLTGDGNKPTAFAANGGSPKKINGIELDFDTVETSDTIIKAAQGIVDEKELAERLRVLARERQAN